MNAKQEKKEKKMGNACYGSVAKKESNIAPVALEIVVGKLADDYKVESGHVLYIRDIVVRRTDNGVGSIYTIRHGEKVECVKVTRLASYAIIAELRACFMDNTALTTMFFVTNDSGFNIGHFKLFRDIHPTDLDAQNILTSLLCEMTP